MKTTKKQLDNLASLCWQIVVKEEMLAKPRTSETPAEVK